jgi:hypothetical protein
MTKQAHQPERQRPGQQPGQQPLSLADFGSFYAGGRPVRIAGLPPA